MRRKLVSGKNPPQGEIRMKRYLMLLMPVLAACSLTSCFQNETTLHLNKDGSGTIVEQTAFGPQALEMLGQLAQLGGAGGGDPVGDLASAEKAKERAAKFGQGVTVERAEAFEKGGYKGGRITYRFEDINQLKFSPDAAAKNAIPSIPGAPVPQMEDPEPVVFRYEGGKLTVTLPDPANAEKPDGEPNLPAGRNIGPDEEAMMKQMFADMKVSFKLVIEPGISGTDATHVEGNTIVLSEMELGKVLEKPGTIEKLSKLDRSKPGVVFDQLKGLDGVKVETKREFTVTVK